MTSPAFQPKVRSLPADAALAPDVAQRPAIDPDTAWFLDFLFSEQDGWLCAGYIDGDPSIPKGQPGYTPLDADHQEWFHSWYGRADALAWLAWHDTQGHNTYVRQCLFASRSGKKGNALPSPIIWRDDAKDEHTPCSVLLETSEGNYQALIKLDRLASTAERQRMMTEWRNAHAGSCECSADPVHFIRVPGGHNSKRHGWYLVHYAQRSERIYNADRLLARCKGGNTPSSGAVSAARAEQHDAANWKQLPDGRRLLDSPRWQAIINGRPQLRIQLIEHQRVTITNKNGAQDASVSAQRSVFVQNLITSWSEKSPGHLPEREIRAAALTLKPLLGSGMTMEAYQVDIDCLINSYRPQVYRPVATRRLAAKRKRGRPAGGLGAQTIALLRAIEAIEPDAFGRRILNLDAFGAPRRTVQYRLAALRKAGLLITKQIGGNGPLYAILTPKPKGGAQVYSSAVEPPIVAAEPPETPIVAAAHGETKYQEREGVYPPDRAREFAPPAGQPGDKEQHHEQHVGRSDEADQPGGCGERAGSGAAILAAPAAQSANSAIGGNPAPGQPDTGRGDEATASAPLTPTLEDLAAYYLSTPATAIGKRCNRKTGADDLVDRKTGEIVVRQRRDLYRRSAQHFAELVAPYGYDCDAAIAAYAAERARRDELARQEWERFFKRLKAMSDDELIAYIAGRCRAEVVELAREGAIFDQHLYQTRLECARRQLEWRGLKMPDPKLGRRSLAPRRSPRSQTPAPAVASLQLDMLAADAPTVLQDGADPDRVCVSVPGGTPTGVDLDRHAGASAASSEAERPAVVRTYDADGMIERLRRSKAAGDGVAASV